jgi:putative transposase
MLGVEVSERTVSRVLRTLPRRPSQTWKTFLNNHIGHIVAVDFLTVPTITLKVLFVFVVIAHRRREVLHFNVTEHPTAEWIARQLVEACDLGLRLRALGIQQIRTTPASPWQNANAERLIGSIRRECLNLASQFTSSR